MKKLIAAVVLAGAALIATPAAANAAGYVPTSNVSVSGSSVAGGTTVINFGPGSFVGNETVNISVTGAGAVTLGALPTTTVSKAYVASASGAVNPRITLPAGASGTYTLTATGATSGNVGTAAVTATPAAGAAAVGGAGSGTGSLAFTGGTISALALWVGGGAVVLGGGLLVVRGSVRRQRDGQIAA
ncbi:sortase [Curtobacterium sp. VKM Ac-2865]|uniref:sortase n=1 Tax=Curtobacterium sp. VKM Ac-2865 TaxID=2783817 RepID=UPI00188BCF24|nr:sortase [Curtobacterium sp. VKM Ac-2865]MBF4582930.1 sortase [Curtobacterium sp. VKM Ac-2865]